MTTLRQLLRPALPMLLLFTLLTGIIYPLATAGVARLLFPHRATGSVVLRCGVPVGSALLGQQFYDPRYFRGRPSATAPHPYDAEHSGGSNLGPTNPALAAAVAERVAALRRGGNPPDVPVPVDLLTASGSGLDPHVSPAAALYQAPRVAAARGIPQSTVKALVAACTEGRQLGVLGEPRVNVLLLNLALDEQSRCE